MALSWIELDILSDPHEAEYHGDPEDVLVALAELLEGRPEWHSFAACRGMGPGLFFPDRGQPQDPARAICETCPVRQECLDAALVLVACDDFGVWGGESAQARKRLRRSPDTLSVLLGVDSEAKAHADTLSGCRCIDCGGACTRTRCLGCHNTSALAAMSTDVDIVA